MVENYAGVLLYTLLGLGFTIGSIVIVSFLAPNRPDAEKLSTYECGCEPFSNAKERSSIRFYIFAILFVLFDVETAFLFPWAVAYNKIGIFGFIEMMLFLGILIVGYVYAWKKGALEWV